MEFILVIECVRSVLGGLYILHTTIFLPSLATISIIVDSTSFSLKISISVLHLKVMPFCNRMAVPPPLLCFLLLQIRVYPGTFTRLSVDFVRNVSHSRIISTLEFFDSKACSSCFKSERCDKILLIFNSRMTKFKPLGFRLVALCRSK